MEERNIVDIERPDDLDPGRLMDRIGSCPYCGQRHYVKALPEDGEETLAALAADQCGCEQARAGQKLQDSVNSVASQIENGFTGIPRTVKDAINGALFPVASGSLKKASFTAEGGVSYTVYRKEGKLRFLRTKTEQDEVEE